MSSALRLSSPSGLEETQQRAPTMARPNGARRRSSACLPTVSLFRLLNVVAGRMAERSIVCSARTAIDSSPESELA